MSSKIESIEQAEHEFRYEEECKALRYTIVNSEYADEREVCLNNLLVLVVRKIISDPEFSYNFGIELSDAGGGH
jgi:hypothetical protein